MPPPPSQVAPWRAAEVGQDTGQVPVVLVWSHRQSELGWPRGSWAKSDTEGGIYAAPGLQASLGQWTWTLVWSRGAGQAESGTETVLQVLCPPCPR